MPHKTIPEPAVPPKIRPPLLAPPNEVPSRKSPTPNVEKLVKAWKVRDLTQWIRAVPPAELVAKLATSEESINMDSFLERLSAATLDDKARITAKDSDGVLHGLRF
ncbi:hypothetical protein CF326_g8190 [Tilletia indica]|nr:hypothetical protein CF326_g8190 [Tilletia indica]